MPALRLLRLSMVPTARQSRITLSNLKTLSLQSRSHSDDISPNTADSDSQRQQARSVNAQIVEFSNEVVSLSQSALTEAWALRHLAEWNEANRTSELRPQLKCAA